MNYMINDPASKQVAIAFARWSFITGMWNSDLTFDEQYECWMKELDSEAYYVELAYDNAEYEEMERQYEYMSGAYED